MKKITLGMVALMTLFFATTGFAQCFVPQGTGGQSNATINGANGSDSYNVNVSLGNPGVLVPTLDGTNLSDLEYAEGAVMLSGENPDANTPVWTGQVAEANVGGPSTYIAAFDATGLTPATTYTLFMRTKCDADAGPSAWVQISGTGLPFTTSAANPFENYAVSVNPVTPTDAPTISVDTYGDYLNANNNPIGASSFSAEEISYCIGAGCDPFTAGTPVAQSGVNTSDSVSYSTTVPMQADGTVVRWAARYTRDAVGFPANLPAEVRTSDVQEYTVEVTLSADDFKLNNVQVFPNPATSQVAIKGLDTVDKISVYNMLGARMIETDQLTINTSSLKTGLYMLKIEFNGSSATKRLIIK